MTKNVAHSVRARLTNRAQETGRPFQEVLQHYGLERFLARVAESAHRDRFVLKGALLLSAWGAPLARPTRDIDFLGYLENEISVVANVVREICANTVVDDGLTFDVASIQGIRIKEDADYPGVRITFIGFLDRARIPMQLDVGFGDVVHPRVDEGDYPTLLGHPAPRLRMYPRETVVAEKFEAMVQLGSMNSRMKDFFDLWLLSRRFDFVGLELARAIEKTFAHRGTRLDADPIALDETFAGADSTRTKWGSFVKRSNLEGVPSFDELRGPLRTFLVPIATALVSGRSFDARWTGGGPWQEAQASRPATDDSVEPNEETLGPRSDARRDS